jgi:hypothetical protein
MQSAGQAACGQAVDTPVGSSPVTASPPRASTECDERNRATVSRRPLDGLLQGGCKEAGGRPRSVCGRPGHPRYRTACDTDDLLKESPELEPYQPEVGQDHSLHVWDLWPLPSAERPMESRWGQIMRGKHR